MDQSYRWVIVAAGGLMGCVAMGAMFSLPVLLDAHDRGNRVEPHRHLCRDDGWVSGNGRHLDDLGRAL